MAVEYVAIISDPAKIELKSLSDSRYETAIEQWKAYNTSPSTAHSQ